MIVNAYSGREGLSLFLEESIALLKEYAQAQEIELKIWENK